MEKGGKGNEQIQSDIVKAHYGGRLGSSNHNTDFYIPLSDISAEGRRRINAQISLDVYICGVKRDKNVHVYVVILIP